MEQPPDRVAEDVGNVVKLEHVNLRVPDQGLATTFYVTGLGLTRDPYIGTGTGLMWINAGQHQIHMPTGSPDLLRGVTALVTPDREALLQRLADVRQALADTRFTIRERKSFVEATCPWGNRWRCHTPDPDRFGRIVLGMPYIEFDVPPGAAVPVARFYQEILEAPAEVADDDEGRHARVRVGINQELIFRETHNDQVPYDRHHMQIYITDFSGPHRRLAALGLLTADTLEHEYRFQDIVDLDTRRVVFTVEHEVRSMRHPLFGRPLVNRNPAQTNRAYMPGRDALGWGME